MACVAKYLNVNTLEQEHAVLSVLLVGKAIFGVCRMTHSDI